MSLSIFIISIPFITLLWQYVALRCDKLTLGRVNLYRPTMAIDHLTILSYRLWDVLGRFCAYVSSFYVYLGFEDLGLAAVQLAKSSWQLLCSAGEFTRSYVSTINLYDNPYLVVAGSLTLLSSIVLGISFYLAHQPSAMQLINSLFEYKLSDHPI